MSSVCALSLRLKTCVLATASTSSILGASLSGSRSSRYASFYLELSLLQEGLHAGGDGEGIS